MQLAASSRDAVLSVVPEPSREEAVGLFDQLLDKKVRGEGGRERRGVREGGREEEGRAVRNTHTRSWCHVHDGGPMLHREWSMTE